jgi:membrane-anchored protein YejM (alkaline phosphatase superfamily)
MTGQNRFSQVLRCRFRINLERLFAPLVTNKALAISPRARAARCSKENNNQIHSGQRDSDYVEYMRHLSVPQIPHKIDIVWIVVESFRADAIDENMAPYLWNHRDDFQLKLNQNHWSGGNCSQFGLFSMFTGVSGYHWHRHLF